MIIVMANPWKHPQTGTFYYRGRVPADLSKQLKGQTVNVTVAGDISAIRFGEACKVSLRTKSSSEARARFADVQSQLQSYWDAARQGAVQLSFKQVCALAGEVYRETLRDREENPGSPDDWQFLRYQMADAMRWFEGNDEDGTPPNPKQGEVAVSKLASIDHFLAVRGIKLTPAGYRAFAEQAGGALYRAYSLLERRARGNYKPSDNEALFPAWTGLQHEEAVTVVAADLLSLFEGWAREAQPAGETYRGWKPYLTDFARHVGHMDASRYKRSDVVGWKDALVERGDAVKTINDSKLASLKTVLKWAFSNERIPANVAAGISVRQRKKPGEVMKEFTEGEAASIFHAAEKEVSPPLRWVPVICALSGARVSEICQLRSEDVREEDGIHFMEITARAGSVKNLNSERCVPLHSYLVRSGFLDFVRERGPGPLFYNSTRRKADAKKPSSKIVAKNVAAWVHRLGLKVGRAHRKDPNHAWRHRFITLAREDDEVKETVLKRLVGQAPKDAHQGYGSASLKTLARAVEAVPIPSPSPSPSLRSAGDQK